MINELKESDSELVRAKINTETAKIPWKELQRFFASGKTLLIHTELDLVEVAYAFQQDNTKQVSRWTNDDKITAVSTEQAKIWIEEDSAVWAVVVKPWVLIQDA